jgi:hypothetical protein
LTEHTLGTFNQGNDPPTLGTYSGAVDIDASYIDTAYLPGAIVPLNPRVPNLNQVGYVGTPQLIDQFKGALQRFIAAGSPYAGWLLFVSDTTRNTILKLASTAHAVAGDPDLTPPGGPGRRSRRSPLIGTPACSRPIRPRSARIS